MWSGAGGYIAEFQVDVQTKNNFQCVPPNGIRDDVGSLRNYDWSTHANLTKKQKPTFVLQADSPIVAHGPNACDEARTGRIFLHPRNHADLA